MKNVVSLKFWRFYLVPILLLDIFRIKVTLANPIFEFKRTYRNNNKVSISRVNKNYNTLVINGGIPGKRVALGVRPQPPFLPVSPGIPVSPGTSVPVFPKASFSFFPMPHFPSFPKAPMPFPSMPNSFPPMSPFPLFPRSGIPTRQGTQFPFPPVSSFPFLQGASIPVPPKGSVSVLPKIPIPAPPKVNINTSHKVSINVSSKIAVPVHPKAPVSVPQPASITSPTRARVPNSQQASIPVYRAPIAAHHSSNVSVRLNIKHNSKSNSAYVPLPQKAPTSVYSTYGYSNPSVPVSSRTSTPVYRAPVAAHRSRNVAAPYNYNNYYNSRAPSSTSSCQKCPYQ